jgi:hypothetical protein
MRNIYDVLELGPIVAQDEDMGCLITINGSYLNFWVERDFGRYENTDCRSFSETELNTLTWVQAMDIAEKYLKEVIFEATIQDEEEE